MTLVNRLEGFQSIIESAKAQVSSSANTQLVVELTAVGTFLKDVADLAGALETQQNITQSNQDIQSLTTLLTGSIARVLKPALEAQPVQVQPAAIAQAVTPANAALQAQFDAGLQAEASENALTADIERQLAEQQAQAQAVAPQPAQVQPVAQPYVPTTPYPAPAGVLTQAEVQAYQQPAPVAPAPAPIGGQDLTANFRKQLADQTPTAPVAPTAPAHPVTQTVQAEDPLTASIRAQVGGQTAPVVPTTPVPAAPVTEAQQAMQNLFDANLKEVRGQ